MGGGGAGGGALEICSGFWGECLWRPVISVLLPPGFPCWCGSFSVGVLHSFGASIHWITFG